LTENKETAAGKTCQHVLRAYLQNYKDGQMISGRSAQAAKEQQPKLNSLIFVCGLLFLDLTAVPTVPRSPLQVSPEFKAKVMEILSAGNYENLRSSKMSQDELLALLAAFNAHGIHFV
jgi:hypothetical protein